MGGQCRKAAEKEKEGKVKVAGQIDGVKRQSGVPTKYLPTQQELQGWESTNLYLTISFCLKSLCLLHL